MEIKKVSSIRILCSTPPSKASGLPDSAKTLVARRAFRASAEAKRLFSPAAGALQKALKDLLVKRSAS